MPTPFRTLEIGNGDVVHGSRTILRLHSDGKKYSDAQFDDYGGLKRKDYLWRPGTHLALQARFSHHQEELKGTAGFGFWNAPFGDPSVRWLALPQAVWYFFGSKPGNLPLAESGPGRGWFVSTVDATRPAALVTLAASPAILLLNQITAIRSRVWPFIRQQMGMSYHQLDIDLREQHYYELHWLHEECRFSVDEELVYRTDHSPRGPLGFVSWMDNQYLVVTPRGRFKWGTIRICQEQWMEIENLKIDQISQ